MILKVLDQSKAFFDLDIEVKMSFLSDKNSRGYIPVGLQIVDQKKQSTGDTKVGLASPLNWLVVHFRHLGCDAAGKPLRTPMRLLLYFSLLIGSI